MYELWAEKPLILVVDGPEPNKNLLMDDWSHLIKHFPQIKNLLEEPKAVSLKRMPLNCSGNHFIITNIDSIEQS